MGCNYGNKNSAVYRRQMVIRHLQTVVCRCENYEKSVIVLILNSANDKKMQIRKLLKNSHLFQKFNLYFNPFSKKTFRLASFFVENKLPTLHYYRHSFLNSGILLPTINN